MKKIISVSISLILLLSLLTGCGTVVYEGLNSDGIIGQGTAENDIEATDYRLYLENDSLELYINPDTTELKVVNKKDGSEWYSSSRSGIREADRALLHLTYVDSSGMTGELNSFENAVKSGQYEIVSDEDKITIKYSVGDFSSEVHIPEVIDKERYNQLLESFDDEFDAMKFSNYYYYFDKDEIDSKEMQNEYFSKYPILKEKAMYVINNSVLSTSNVKKEFAEILSNCNYTEEMYKEDSKNFKSGDDEIKEAGVNIALELSLDGGDFNVTVPNSQIEMYSEYLVTEISVLRYFASPTAEEKGWYLLPDGSGSVMNFYNGKTDGHDYSVTVYGTGYALSEREKTSNYSNAALPIFAVNRGNAAVFAEITGGEAVASIKAYSGDDTKASFAGPLFRFREIYTTQLSTGKKENFSTVQKQRFGSDMSVKYSFLTGDETDYCAMAELYSERLFGNTENSCTDKINAVFEFIGQFDKQAQMFGISYDKKVSASTFTAVGNAAEELKDAGIENLNIRLSGWMSDGYSHGSLSKVKPSSRLGGKSGLNELKEKLSGLEGVLWYDADVQYTKTGGIGSDSDAIRTIGKSVGKTYSYNLASFTQLPTVTSRRVNNISTVLKELGYFEKYAEKASVSNISLRSIGSSVNADYNEDCFTDNQTAADKTAEALNKLSEKGISIMTAGANKYALSSAEMCLSLPAASNEYDSTDISVPFLQMVLKGSVSYTGKALNLTGDVNEALLYAAQTGSDIYCVLTADNAEELNGSGYDELYSVDYKYYRDTLAERIAEYQTQLKVTAGKKITGFKYLTDEVTETVFENGAKVYVNFGNKEVTAAGVKIPAESYSVKGR